MRAGCKNVTILSRLSETATAALRMTKHDMREVHVANQHSKNKCHTVKLTTPISWVLHMHHIIWLWASIPV